MELPLDLRSQVYPEIVILPMEAQLNDFDRVCRRLNMLEQDKETLLHDIVQCLYTVDDEDTLAELSQLPNPNNMVSQSYLQYDYENRDFTDKEVLPSYMQNSQGERSLKEVVQHVGMAIHHQLKLHGFYDPVNFNQDGFMYVYKMRYGRDLMLVKLPTSRISHGY